MSMIAFPLNDDGLVSDMDDFIAAKNGRVIRGSISRQGIPLLHVEFPDQQDIAADIMRRKLSYSYQLEAA